MQKILADYYTDAIRDKKTFLYAAEKIAKVV